MSAQKVEPPRSWVDKHPYGVKWLALGVTVGAIIVASAFIADYPAMAQRIIGPATYVGIPVILLLMFGGMIYENRHPRPTEHLEELFVAEELQSIQRRAAAAVALYTEYGVPSIVDEAQRLYQAAAHLELSLEQRRNAIG